MNARGENSDAATDFHHMMAIVIENRQMSDYTYANKLHLIHSRLVQTSVPVVNGSDVVCRVEICSI